MTILLNDTPIAATPVTIAIKPAGSSNRINPRSNGTVRVAVLSEASCPSGPCDQGG